MSCMYIQDTVQFLCDYKTTLLTPASPPSLQSQNIHWYYPNGSEITPTQATFQSSRRRMILSNVQETDAGVYRCEARLVQSTPGFPSPSDSTTILLNVHGKSNILWKANLPVISLPQLAILF